MDEVDLRHRFGRKTFIAMIVLVATAPSYSQGQTIYEPSANDPRIKAVLEAVERVADAARRADWKAVEAFFAPDVVVNSPTNRVVALADIMARFRSGQIGACAAIALAAGGFIAFAVTGRPPQRQARSPS